MPADTLYPGICNILQATVGILSEVGGHSTTTWTEYCHFLMPPLPAWTVFIPSAWKKHTIDTNDTSEMISPHYARDMVLTHIEEKYIGKNRWKILIFGGFFMPSLAHD